jgi:GTP-binding protein HflX
VRQLKLPGGRRCTISDTVGFVSKLPHDLVEAFRSTLEEVSLAELVVHVADAGSSDLAEQIDAVRRVLDEIGAGAIPEVLVLNKIDRLSGSERARLARRYPGSVPVSALSGEGVEGLLETLEQRLPHPPVEIELLVPYGREDLTALLYRESEVLSTIHEEAGTRVQARVGLRELALVRGFVQHERRTD